LLRVNPVNVGRVRIGRQREEEDVVKSVVKWDYACTP